MDQSFLGIIYFVALSHGLMLTALLFKRSQPREPGRLLAWVAVAICYKLYEGGVLYTGLHRYVAHSMDLLPGMVLVIGPLLWLYTRRVSGEALIPFYQLAMHFLPAVALWFLNAPAVFRNAESKIAMWEQMHLHAHHSLSIQTIVLLLSMKVHLGLYLYFSWRAIQRNKVTSKHLRADNSEHVLTGVQFMVVSFFLLEALWVSLFIAQQFFGIVTLGMVSDIWLLFVALMVLGIGYAGLQKPDLVFTSEEKKLVEAQAQNSGLEDNSGNVKYFHSALPEDTIALLSKELEEHIVSKELYLDDKLTLTDLAKATDVKAHTLSQVINQSMKTNFYKLINSYRVQHAVDLIEDHNVNWSLERIALESGFSNRVTFSKAFKEIMACTPSEYKKRLAKVS